VERQITARLRLNRQTSALFDCKVSAGLELRYPHSARALVRRQKP
jgi:hypothetical protein